MEERSLKSRPSICCPQPPLPSRLRLSLRRLRRHVAMAALGTGASAASADLVCPVYQRHCTPSTVGARNQVRLWSLRRRGVMGPHVVTATLAGRPRRHSGSSTLLSALGAAGLPPARLFHLPAPQRFAQPARAARGAGPTVAVSTTVARAARSPVGPCHPGTYRSRNFQNATAMLSKRAR